MADLIATANYIDTPADIIAPRFLGDYADDLGRKWKDTHAVWDGRRPAQYATGFELKMA